jgi:hypothetical protein
MGPISGLGSGQELRPLLARARCSLGCIAS